MSAFVRIIEDWGLDEHSFYRLWPDFRPQVCGESSWRQPPKTVRPLSCTVRSDFA
jgi:hypothetical protein